MSELRSRAPAGSRPVVQVCESLSEIMFQYTNYVMLLAPLGVFGAMAATVGEKGIGILTNLGKLVLTLYGAEVFFGHVPVVPVAGDQGDEPVRQR